MTEIDNSDLKKCQQEKLTTKLCRRLKNSSVALQSVIKKKIVNLKKQKKRGLVGWWYGGHNINLQQNGFVNKLRRKINLNSPFGLGQI